MHGTTKAEGCAHLRLGNFCRLLPELPTWAEECGIQHQCEAERVAAALGAPGSIMHDADHSSPDSDIPAGYTFFAQFVDHDITLDTGTQLHGRPLAGEEIDSRPNLRSASLDLDCVYAFGPEASPFLYDHSQPGRLLVGSTVGGVENPNDVPRSSEGRALIGDPRNDENLFVSQLQLLFLRFHNRRLVGRGFEEAQRDVRFHYQWIVLYDFLKRVCHPEVYEFALPKIEMSAREHNPDNRDYPFCSILDDCGRICMPVEFSGAAYRFGHTLVRSQYPVNADHPVIELFDERFGTLGFGQVPPSLTVDWRFLLDVDPCHPYAHSKAVDSLLADELIRLPDPVVGRSASDNDRSLAFRNLLRGYVLGLPSGQRAVQALHEKGYPVEPCQDLKFADLSGWACLGDLPCDPAAHTPLFLYVLREGAVRGQGKTLGPVGSAILLEVFGSMFVHCDTFFREKAGWEPDPCIAGPYGLSLADLVRYLSS